MKPKSKKLSVIDRIHHNDSKSSFYDFADLSQALDACASQDFTPKEHTSSIVSLPLVVAPAPAPAQDGLNSVQPVSKSKGCYDFSSLSESLNHIATLNGYKGSSSDSQKYRITLRDNFTSLSRLLKIKERKKSGAVNFRSLLRFRNFTNTRKRSEMLRAGIRQLDSLRGHNSLSCDCEHIFELSQFDYPLRLTKII